LYAQGGPKKTKTAAAFATSPLEDEEHVLSILASLFTSLDSETSARIRTLHKFVENDYEKIDRLLEMREGAVSRLSRVEREVEMEKRVSTSKFWRLAAGHLLSQFEHADNARGWGGDYGNRDRRLVPP